MARTIRDVTVNNRSVPEVLNEINAWINAHNLKIEENNGTHLRVKLPKKSFTQDSLVMENLKIIEITIQQTSNTVMVHTEGFVKSPLGGGEQEFSPNAVVGGLPKKAGWKAIEDLWKRLGLLSSGPMQQMPTPTQAGYAVPPPIPQPPYQHQTTAPTAQQRTYPPPSDGQPENQQKAPLSSSPQAEYPPPPSLEGVADGESQRKLQFPPPYNAPSPPSNQAPKNSRKKLYLLTICIVIIIIVVVGGIYAYQQNQISIQHSKEIGSVNSIYIEITELNYTRTSTYFVADIEVRITNYGSLPVTLIGGTTSLSINDVFLQTKNLESEATVIPSGSWIIYTGSYGVFDSNNAGLLRYSTKYNTDLALSATATCGSYSANIGPHDYNNWTPNS
jgi:hypothetical protein